MKEMEEEEEQERLEAVSAATCDHSEHVLKCCLQMLSDDNASHEVDEALLDELLAEQEEPEGDMGDEEADGASSNE
jgi:DNA-binding TFAR19-related protein (PDSD5 family)